MAFVRFGDPVMPARRLRERHSVLRTLNRSGRPRGSRSRRASLAVAAGAAGSLALFGLAAPASAQPAQVSVPQGIGGAAAMQPTGVFTPGSTPETVSFILKARNLASLEGSVAAGMPGGYLSVRQFASSYGQSAANIAALEKYLTGFGHQGQRRTRTAWTSPRPARLTSSTARSTVQQQQYMVPAVPARGGQPGRPATEIHGTVDEPLLPANLGAFVLSILGLTNYPTFSSTAVHEPALATGVKPSADADRQPDAGRLRQAVQPEPAVRARARPARGRTIGIVTLASLDPATPEYFWNNILRITTKANRITLDNVDGGSGPVSNASGSGETTPGRRAVRRPRPAGEHHRLPGPEHRLRLRGRLLHRGQPEHRGHGVGELGRVGDRDPGLGQRRARSPTPTPISFDEAYLELAAQGQSAFVSAGDFGAYTAAEDLGTTNLSRRQPGQQPVDHHRGRHHPAGHDPADRDGLGHDHGPADLGLGLAVAALRGLRRTVGGGLRRSPSRSAAAAASAPSSRRRSTSSSCRARTSSAPCEYLTPIDLETVAPGLAEPTAWNFNPTPAVQTGYGTGRATPDVSADADPFTGYELYFTVR